MYSQLRYVMTALAVTVLAACSDSTEPGGISQVSVTMQKSSTVTSAALVAAAQGSVDPSQVASLHVTITDIAFLPVLAEDDSTSDDGWISLSLDTPVQVDLVALPGEDDSTLVIGSGVLPEGDYKKVRFFVTNSIIRFSNTISVGNATFEADSTYDVRIPSGEQTGIKTDLAFSVVADTAVNLLFDENATLGNVSATGSGKVNLSPVFKARGGTEE